MTHRSQRVDSVKRKALSELLIGTSLINKLHELENEEELGEVSGTSRIRSMSGCSKVSTKDLHQNVEGMDVGISKKQSHWKKVIFMKDSGMLKTENIASINKKQLSKVEKTNPVLLSGTEGADGEKNTIFVNKKNADLSDLFNSIYNTAPVRMASFTRDGRSYRAKSLTCVDMEDDVATIVMPSYPTKEAHLELRKKIFYKGEYMMLNYALLIIILLIFVFILFESLWDRLGGQKTALFIGLGVVVGCVSAVIITVKVKLRLARRAPGSYKYTVNTAVIDNKVALANNKTDNS